MEAGEHYTSPQLPGFHYPLLVERGRGWDGIPGLGLDFAPHPSLMLAAVAAPEPKH